MLRRLRHVSHRQEVVLNDGGREVISCSGLRSLLHSSSSSSTGHARVHVCTAAMCFYLAPVRARTCERLLRTRNQTHRRRSLLPHSLASSFNFRSDLRCPACTRTCTSQPPPTPTPLGEAFVSFFLLSRALVWFQFRIKPTNYQPGSPNGPWRALLPPAAA